MRKINILFLVFCIATTSYSQDTVTLRTKRGNYKAILRQIKDTSYPSTFKQFDSVVFIERNFLFRIIDLGAGLKRYSISTIVNGRTRRPLAAITVDSARTVYTNTIQILGYNVRKLPQLKVGEQKYYTNLLDTLNLVPKNELKAILTKFQLQDTSIQIFTGLNSLVQALQTVSGKNDSKGLRGCQGQACVPDECTFIYEGSIFCNWGTLNFAYKSWEECCNTHDNCYCVGGTEKQRQRCDNRFKACIKEMGCEWYGGIFAWAVKNFGKDHFCYTTITIWEKIKEIEPLLPTDCVIETRLRRIKYEGSDIGNDTKYTCQVDIFHGGTRVSNQSKYINNSLDPDDNISLDVVLGSYQGPSCGDNFRFVFYFSFKEDDFSADDEGEASKTFNRLCNNETYSAELEFSVIENRGKLLPDGGRAKIRSTIEISRRCIAQW